MSYGATVRASAANTCIYMYSNFLYELKKDNFCSSFNVFISLLFFTLIYLFRYIFNHAVGGGVMV